MKIGKHIILLAVACVLSFSVYADTRHYEKGEKIYLNAKQGEMDWSTASAHLFLYIWGSTGVDWVTMSKENGDIFVGDMPAGDWDEFIVVRKNEATTTSGWDNNIWNKTCDLPFVNNPDINCINEFWIGGDNCKGSAKWATYAPSLVKIGAFASAETEENIKVCPNALGSLLSLHPKLKADKSNYDYDNVKCHGWYVSTDNKSTWKSVDNYAGSARDGEKNQDTAYVLPNSLSSGAIYFYLHSSKKVGRRLIKITADATKCDLDCEITSLEIALSAVNANDTTYTLDGVVAFGEPSGDLVITCGTKSTTISKAQAKSPQIFKIEGLPAATNNTTSATVTAQFTGSGNKCTMSKTFTVPNAVEGIKTSTIHVLVGETKNIHPDNADYDYTHEWYLNHEKQKPQDDLTTTPRQKATTDTYMYQEFNPPVGEMIDVMKNGSYEEDGMSAYGSDYDYWGRFDNADAPIDYYKDHKDANNGFAVVRSANKFAPTYAKVVSAKEAAEARDGSYFALFDAASGNEMTGRKAWYTNTDKNSDLKLKKGTTYLLSFWAANINNYGEMDNAAVLEFQINGQSIIKLDLGIDEFRNNRWHQCSAIYEAKTEINNVTISVINSNSNRLWVGNDFALDDIQFRPVSNNTPVVRIQRIYYVQTHEPHVKALAVASTSLGCDSTAYKVDITVTYDNPKGQLVIEDETTGQEVFRGDVPAVGNDWDKPKTKTISNIRIAELKGHIFKATFAEWGDKSYAEGSSTAPEFNSCCTDGRIYRKWDNVLFVNNGDSIYERYQWYKNGEKMNGETMQRLYTASKPMADTPDLYHCVATRMDGTEETFCAHAFNDFPESRKAAAIEDITLDGMTVYPTHVVAGGKVTVRKAFAGSAQASLLTLTGGVLSCEVLTDDQSTLTMPTMQGIYLLRITSGNLTHIAKIVVY